MISSLLPLLGKVPSDLIKKAGGLPKIISAVTNCYSVAQKLKNGATKEEVLAEAIRMSNGKLTAEHFGIVVDIIEQVGLKDRIEQMSPGICSIFRSLSKTRTMPGLPTAHTPIANNSVNNAVSDRLRPLKIRKR